MPMNNFIMRRKQRLREKLKARRDGFGMGGIDAADAEQPRDEEGKFAAVAGSHGFSHMGSTKFGAGGKNERTQHSYGRGETEDPDEPEEQLNYTPANNHSWAHLGPNGTIGKGEGSAALANHLNKHRRR